jgi:hypothetical protein
MTPKKNLFAFLGVVVVFFARYDILIIMKKIYQKGICPMKKSLLVLTLLLLLFISGCATDQDTEREALRSQLETAQQDLIKFNKEIERLSETNESLQSSLEEYANNESISFKDVVKMTVIVLDKQSGTDLYPYYIIVSDTDVDFNTPLLLTIEDRAAYNKIVVGEEYTFDVFITNVIEENKTHIQYSFSIE